MRHATHLLLTSLLACGLGFGLAAQQGKQEPPPPPGGAGVTSNDDHGHAHADDGAPAPVQPQTEFKDGGKNEWFELTQRHLGTYFQEEEASGEFAFKNPRDKIHKIYNMQPSCTCSSVRIKIGDRVYEIGSDKVLNKIQIKDGLETKQRIEHVNVGPGESGTIEVHMKMDGVQGDKDADLQVMTSDSKLPVVSLRWRATGAQYFIADPPEISLNEMTWSDKREFEFTVYSPLRKDFNIVDHEPLSKSMKVAMEKGKRADGRTQYTIKGSYGPGADERDSGGQIVLNTDFDGKKVTVNVSAFLKGPLEMKPGGFVGLGPISSKDGKTVDIEFIPNGDFDLQVEKVEIVRLNLRDDGKAKIRFEPVKDGKAVKVRIVIDKGMPRGYITGMLQVHLNHPSARLKEVMFNGFVR